MDNLVNLFLVGPPKTATSSIAYYLSQHNDIFISTEKEPHYFCKDFIVESERFHENNGKFNITSIDQYHELFSNTQSFKYKLDASTSYFYSKEAYQNIYKYNPEAKVIIILRNPIDLLHSWYKYLRFRSEENINTFSEALLLEDKRKNDITLIPKSVKHPTRIFYTEIVDFYKHTNNFLSTFNENVLVLFTEDIRNNSTISLNKIMSFLELDKYSPNLKMKRLHREVRFSKLKWFLDNQLFYIKKIFNNILPTPIYEIVSKIYTSSMSRQTVRENIDKSTYHTLKYRFGEMVVNLSTLLDVDLANKWNFK